jgi:hypothetical protein
MAFDLMVDGRARSMPTRHENALMSYLALRSSAERVLDALGHSQVPRTLLKELMFLARSPVDDAEAVATTLQAPRLVPTRRALRAFRLDDEERALAAHVRHLTGWTTEVRRSPEATVDGPGLLAAREALAHDDEFCWLVQRLKSASVLALPVPASPGAEVSVKLAYEQDIHKERSVASAWALKAGWRAISYTIETPYAAGSSYHFEFKSPNDLEVVDSGLYQAGGGPAVSDPAALPTYEPRPNYGSQVHLYRPNATPVDEMSVLLDLRVTRSGFLAGARAAALATALSITACAALAQPVIRHGNGAPSLLLLFPGLFAAIVGRVGGHPLVGRTLRWPRFALVLSATASFLAAALLALIHTGGKAKAERWEYHYWGALACIAWIAFALLWMSYILPRGPHRRGRLEQIVDRLERTTEPMMLLLTRVRQHGYRIDVRPADRRISASVVDRIAKELNEANQTGRITVRRRRGPGRGTTLRLRQRSPKPPFLKPGHRKTRAGGVHLTTDGARELRALLAELGDRLPGGLMVMAGWSTRKPVALRVQSIHELELVARASALLPRTLYIAGAPHPLWPREGPLFDRVGVRIGHGAEAGPLVRLWSVDGRFYSWIPRGALPVDGRPLVLVPPIGDRRQTRTREVPFRRVEEEEQRNVLRRADGRLRLLRVVTRAFGSLPEERTLVQLLPEER